MKPIALIGVVVSLGSLSANHALAGELAYYDDILSIGVVHEITSNGISLMHEKGQIDRFAISSQTKLCDENLKPTKLSAFKVSDKITIRTPMKKKDDPPVALSVQKGGVAFSITTQGLEFATKVCK
jgi:hypothetical protein